MKNSRLILTLTLASALAVPTAAAFAGDDTRSVSTSKKKLSYCQKQGKAQKGKLFGKVKSAKFFLYTKKKPTEYFFCSESPKYKGMIEAWSGIKKTSSLRAVKNNCAIFYAEGKPGNYYGDGDKELKMISAKFFKKGAVKQTSASRLGTKDQTVALQSLTLAKNCVYAAGYFVDGAPTIVISGTGNFPYTGRVERAATGATAAELKAIKITVNSSTESVVTWTQGGVPKSLTYTATGAR